MKTLSFVEFRTVKDRSGKVIEKIKTGRTVRITQADADVMNKMNGFCYELEPAKKAAPKKETPAKKAAK